MPWACANGIQLFYGRRGAGQRVLAITGTTADLRKHPNILDGPLPASFDVLGFDQRGLGQSEKPDGPYSITDYAADAAGLLDALGWPSAHVVGISFGGMVAQELAIRAPGRVEKLVLCCTTAGGAGGRSYPLHELGGLSREARARHMIPINDVRHDNAWAEANPGEYAKLLRLAAEDPFEGEPRHVEGLQLQLQARGQHDAWDRIPLIRARTLVCGGRHDGVAPPDTQAKLASRISGAQLAFFEGGHFFLSQDASAWEAIADFLRQTQAEPAA